MATSDDLPADLPIESLRRLARGLVLDRGTADDLVQEAWLAALQAQGPIQGLGGWLAGAVRRLARSQAREVERRGRRERAVARPEGLPGAAETSARIELLRRLLAAVDRLNAPYREAVVLRYFDDLPPRAIAARLGVPVNTARTHVRRGIERLRAELDPGSGREREAFLAALLPLLGPGFPPPGAALPGAALPGAALPGTARSWRRLMTHPLALTASALTVATLAWTFGRPSDPAPALGREPFVPSSARAERPSSEPRQANAPAQGSERPAVAERAAGGRAALASEWTLRGHVTSGGWDPLPSARLVGRLFLGGTCTGPAQLEESFTADANGDFAWSPALPAGVLVTLEVMGDQPGFAGPRLRDAFLAGDPAPVDWRVTLYPLDVTVRGTVRGPDGAPLAGAFVGRALGDESRAVRSAEDGSFTLPCPSGSATRGVIAWSPGFAPGYAAFAKPAPGAEIDCVIALGPEMRLAGTVRDASGTPVAGAEVRQSQPGFPGPSAAGNGVRSQTLPLFEGAWPRVLADASGRFELGGIHPEAMNVLLSASAPGLGSITVSRPRPGATRDSACDLTLDAGLSLTGRVRASGEPVHGAWIAAGDYVGELDDVEAWSDADGRFTLTGLPAGPQHLWIWRRGFAQVRHDLVVRAGLAELELELAPGHVVAGLVLGPDGAPVPWAAVNAEDASGARPPRLSGYGTCAGADGRFRLADLPAASIALSVGAKDCAWLRQDVALDREDLLLRLTASPVDGARGSAPTSTSASSSTSAPTGVVPVQAPRGEAALTGRLLDLAGNARANERIELVAVAPKLAGEAPPAPFRVTTDARGDFRLEGLPAGTFDARWLRSEGQGESEVTVADLETRLTLGADETRHLDLQPRGQTQLLGRLEFRTDVPEGSVTTGYGARPALGVPAGGMPPRIPVVLQRLVDGRPVPGTQRGTIAHDGHFELEGLEPGTWHARVELHLAGHKSTNGAAITVPERGSVELVVPLVYVP